MRYESRHGPCIACMRLGYHRFAVHSLFCQANSIGGRSKSCRCRLYSPPPLLYRALVFKILPSPPFRPSVGRPRLPFLWRSFASYSPILLVHSFCEWEVKQICAARNHRLRSHILFASFTLAHLFLAVHKAQTTKHRFSKNGLEWNSRFLATLGAGGSRLRAQPEDFALLFRLALFAASWIALEALIGKELLLAPWKHEFGPALSAGQYPVNVLHGWPSSFNEVVGRFYAAQRCDANHIKEGPPRRVSLPLAAGKGWRSVILGKSRPIQSDLDHVPAPRLPV